MKLGRWTMPTQPLWFRDRLEGYWVRVLLVIVKAARFCTIVNPRMSARTVSTSSLVVFCAHVFDADEAVSLAEPEFGFGACLPD